MRFSGSKDVHYALYDSGAQVCMISQGVLSRISKDAWHTVEGKRVQVRGYIPGQPISCAVIIMHMALGKYGEDYFEHVFCVDPRTDYKIIFGGDLAKGVGAVHDHAEGKVTLKNIPGRRNHLRLPLIPASSMKKSRVYTQHSLLP